MEWQYTYQRKDGGTTVCYGKLEEDSNIQVTCDNEVFDSMVTDNEQRTWLQVCKYLEEHYNSKVEELIAV